MKRIVLSLLLSSTLVLTAIGQAPTPATPKVGTFDKISIVLAFYGSPQWRDTLKQKQQERDAAAEANDSAKLQALNAWGQKSQEIAMQQLVGKAPIDNIIEALQPVFNQLEASLHLTSIVVYPAAIDSRATVDVTPQLLDLLQADARTRKWIAEMHAQSPPTSAANAPTH